MKKIFPLKVINTVFFNLLIFDIFLSAVFLKTKPAQSIYFFLSGLILVAVTALPIFIFHGIKVSNEEVIIKTFGFKGFKKHRFPLKDILRLEMKKGKAYFGIRRYYFVIHVYESSGNKSFIINEERYFVKHLKYLFRYLKESYQIPCYESCLNS